MSDRDRESPTMAAPGRAVQCAEILTFICSAKQTFFCKKKKTICLTVSYSAAILRDSATQAHSAVKRGARCSFGARSYFFSTSA